MYITGKINEETYEQLCKEWQDKLRNVEINISDMERELRVQLDDLDYSLMLIANISGLYTRLKEAEQAKLLQIIAKRIIVNPEGEIIAHELQSPFAYLRSIVDELFLTDLEPGGSEQLRFGAPIKFEM